MLRTSIAEQLVALRGDAPEAMADVVVERIDLPGGAVLRARPRDFDGVREAEALAGPGRPTPYWSTPWPSGTALARFVARQPLRGRSVLELGCGLGLPSVAAARAGGVVTATDRSPEAVVYAAHNLALNQQLGEVAAAGWEDAALLPQRPWDRVIAADVLYLEAHGDALVRILPALLGVDGEVWIGDPGRAGAQHFLALVRSAGWSLVSENDPLDERVRIHRLTRRASGR